MFKLFVLGSVQKPDPAEIRKYLPSLEFFEKSSGVLTRIVKSKAEYPDLESLRLAVRANWQSWCLSGETVCQDVHELHAKSESLSQALVLANARNYEKLVASVEAIVETGIARALDPIPTAFATMTYWYSLNERHELVELARDIIKVAALCMHFDEIARSASSVDKVAFASDFIRKAKPAIGLSLPPTSRVNSFADSSPVPRAEPVIRNIEVFGLQEKIAQINAAIDELDAMHEEKFLNARHAPPTLAQIGQAGMQTAAIPSVHGADEALLDKKATLNTDQIARQVTAVQSAENALATAAANYKQGLLNSSELRLLSADTRKIITPFKEKQGAVNPRLVIDKLRARKKKLDDQLLATPFVIPRAESWMIAHGFMFNLNRSVFDEISCTPPPKPCHCDLLKALDAKHAGLPQLFVLGTGTAYRIDTKFKRYIRSELVHTEAIIAGSKRTSSFRLLNRTEDTTETFTSREEEQEQEATTDDRFKLEKEVAQETKTESEMNMGASLSASYGSVSLAANFGMSSSTATQSKEQQAQEIAQQKTSRALSRIRTKTEERKTSRRLSENERISGFELINEGPSKTAFYHAIDAEYTNQLVCIGTRMVVRVCMQEFMAPLLHMLMSEPENATQLSKPITPDQIPNPFKSSPSSTVLLEKFSDITIDNYESWLATFNITDAPLPPEEKIASAAVSVSTTTGKTEEDVRVLTGSIGITDGYTAIAGHIAINTFAWHHYAAFIVGNSYCSGYSSFNLNHTTAVPWAYIGADSCSGTILVRCKPGLSLMKSWQMKIYDLIWSKYRKELADYENSLQMAKVEAGIAIASRNPLQNEKLVREELMKMVLGATFPQFYYRGLNAMKFGYKCLGKDENSNPITTGAPIPEPDFLDAKAEAPWVTFMSKLYEFENMTFDLKPYFFANRAKWCSLRKLTDVDPRMEAALSAGYVTIDVPISLGMEDAFNHYVATGEIWNGQGMPVVGDAMYQALALEVMNGQNPERLPTENDPWTTVLPTSLVMVTDDAPPDL